MNPLLKWIYLGVVFIFVGILYIGIYRAGPSPDKGPVIEAGTDEEGFKTLAEQREEIEAQTRQAEEQVLLTRIDPEFDSMIFIPAGKFIMGDEKGHPMERPAREIYLDAYYIDKYEVNFGQFYAFVSEAKYSRKPRLAGYLAVDPKGIPVLLNPYSPVVGVAWEDAVAYCSWKGKRLPTEAEWEKAAKGTEPRKWPWGDEENPKFANLVGFEDGFRYTSPGGSVRKDESPYGVFDMAGNAMEWVSSWFREDYYRIMPELNPKGPAEGDSKGIRGGSWNDSILRAKTTIRFKTRPSYRDVTIGFRCAKSEI